MLISLNYKTSCAQCINDMKNYHPASSSDLVVYIVILSMTVIKFCLNYHVANYRNVIAQIRYQSSRKSATHLQQALSFS